MKMKVKDLLAMEICVDVYDNVCEEIGIAFDGPVKLTPAGLKEFGEVLDFDVEVFREEVAIVDVDADDWKHRLKAAKHFFYSFAGYCPAEDWEAWFIIE